ncbi:uncharacterized protein BDZ99DRAFT_470822 [Mytilinidion resinicola]|uniref:Uncharacterized protein n=1 Tax=Mytilinidion resinicola TaxID=574789 RepID=A0A6A6ZCE6_9PEZI|nr:uncharacterized protein BDZ99DRAFT_470822 [Mytilinidion resinicola]KAF2817877.1 hypothetical protein BDZ99DRAFT_470822 [Mytilinidion resinicola]
MSSVANGNGNCAPAGQRDRARLPLQLERRPAKKQKKFGRSGVACQKKATLGNSPEVKASLKAEGSTEALPVELELMMLENLFKKMKGATPECTLLESSSGVRSALTLSGDSALVATYRTLRRIRGLSPLVNKVFFKTVGPFRGNWKDILRLYKNKSVPNAAANTIPWEHIGKDILEDVPFSYIYAASVLSYLQHATGLQAVVFASCSSTSSCPVALDSFCGLQIGRILSIVARIG